jgi:hypothetical protein
LKNIKSYGDYHILWLLRFYDVMINNEQGVEENIWAKEGWSDGRVEKAA